MRRAALIARLRADLASQQRDLWQLTEEGAAQRAENGRLQTIIDRQDETILALWGIIEAQTMVGVA